MSAAWNNFLSSRGATIDDAGWTTFPDTPDNGACRITSLSMLGLLEADGDDAVEFLQGQLTNDILSVSPSDSILAGYCSPKGRMMANFRLFALDTNRILMQTNAMRAAPMLKRLSMFVLRSKVKLSDVSGQYARIGLIGEPCEAFADVLSYAFPDAANRTTLSDDGVFIAKMPGITSRYEIICPVDIAISLWETLAEHATPVSSREWARQDILAGEPNIYESTAEAFVPQMTNLQLINGVSFTKGCYTGQEVVARMQYLGKLKRRMYRARLPEGVSPAPGDELFSIHSASGQGAGKLVDAQPSPDGGFDVLAVVEVRTADAGDIHLGSLEGPLLQLADLPYPFESDADS